MKYSCNKCGAELVQTDYFCPGCGQNTGLKTKRLIGLGSGLTGCGCLPFLFILIGLPLLATSGLSLSEGDPNSGAAALWLLIPAMVLAVPVGLTGLVFLIIGLVNRKYKKAS